MERKSGISEYLHAALHFLVPWPFCEMVPVLREKISPKNKPETKMQEEPEEPDFQGFGRLAIPDPESGKIPPGVLAYGWLVALSAGPAHHREVTKIRDRLETRLEAGEILDGQRLAFQVRSNAEFEGTLGSLPARTHCWVGILAQKNPRNRDLLHSLEAVLTGDQIRESREYQNLVVPDTEMH